MRYTRKGDWVLDLFAGSGTILVECKRWDRNAVGVELVSQVAGRANQLTKAQKNPRVFPKTIIGDSTSICTRRHVEAILTANNVSQVQLIILHPPYYNIVRFSDDPRDLPSAPSIPIFLKKLKRVVRNFADCARFKSPRPRQILAYTPQKPADISGWNLRILRGDLRGKREQFGRLQTLVLVKGLNE